MRELLFDRKKWLDVGMMELLKERDVGRSALASNSFCQRGTGQKQRQEGDNGTLEEVH
eukprot:CAMPEP_0168760548 /NCGR_PEP_ID=MMETSP0724-20121128/22833_1 /TAXON_ID=265536 /ORGANISM="Amphiprora sp., Strain CCMP467" /LENGTH=57 /DNA_ID=CAMNT_0008809581 /DNA_START=492 /DNA_END=663 /DNA_ORIENTATION=-